MAWIRGVARGVLNCWRWLPIVWADRDYDWVFLARVMEFKLHLMAECIEHGYLEGGARDAARMRLAARLLRRLQDDEYHVLSGWWAVYEARTRGIPLTESFQIPIPPEERKLLLRMRRLELRDQRLLGKLLGRYLTSWWE